MPRGLPRGASQRRAAQYGRSLTLVNENVNVDRTDPWNDATTTTEQVTVLGFVDRSPSDTERQEWTDHTNADATVRIPAVELGGFEIRDFQGDKTVVNDGEGREFVVISYQLTTNNVYECEVRRQ